MAASMQGKPGTGLRLGSASASDCIVHFNYIRDSNRLGQMSLIGEDSPTDKHPADDEIDWRVALQARFRPVVVVLIFLGGVATLAGHRSETMRVFGIVLVIHSVLLIGLLWSSWISTRVQSVIILASLASASVAAYLIVGYLPGGAMAAAFVMVLATLLVGRKSFIGLLAAFTLFLAGLTVAVTTGWWSGPAPIDLDPTDPIIWMRTSFVTVVLWASLGFSVLFVVDTIEQNLSRRRIALDSLKKEVTERRAAEDARRRAEAIAFQSQKLEAVGQLAAGIAHDFNNALVVIQGWNEMRGALDSDEAQREATAAIEQASDRTTQLSRQLLTFARKDLRTPRYLRLDRLVGETAKTLQNLVGAHIRVSIESEPDRVIFADETQIQQMLFNLVINARDAIEDKGNIRVTVRSADRREAETMESPTADWVVLEVADDGCGIDRDSRERIFEPFFTTKEPGLGTGLGLSTVFGIVQQTGGHIEFTSEPGHTVFSIYLPWASIDEVSSPATAKQTSVSMLDLRVLVLEDDALVRKLIVTVLENNGCDVVACADGDEALALLGDETPSFDVLCSDAVFPGAELGDVLEAFERHSPAAKVLICSGYVRQELAIRKVESGEYAFLSKPFTSAQFAEKIRDTVEFRAA